MALLKHCRVKLLPYWCYRLNIGLNYSRYGFIVLGEKDQICLTNARFQLYNSRDESSAEDFRKVCFVKIPFNDSLFVIAAKEAAGPPKIQEPIVSGDPGTCQIHPGRETRIEIQKGKSGLGLSIVGGADTLLVRLICFCMLVHYLC